MIARRYTYAAVAIGLKRWGCHLAHPFRRTGPSDRRSAADRGFTRVPNRGRISPGSGWASYAASQRVAPIFRASMRAAGSNVDSRPNRCSTAAALATSADGNLGGTTVAVPRGEDSKPCYGCRDLMPLVIRLQCRRPMRAACCSWLKANSISLP